MPRKPKTTQRQRDAAFEMYAPPPRKGVMHDLEEHWLESSNLVVKGKVGPGPIDHQPTAVGILNRD